ncbi:uncharacterized protein [Notamacropus eugenii]|uniref:uncharacterized protein n=1 Tax=Notamacropus eugenii TaxID=9315 RepID=UPI003B66C724
MGGGPPTRQVEEEGEEVGAESAGAGGASNINIHTHPSAGGRGRGRGRTEGPTDTGGRNERRGGRSVTCLLRPQWETAEAGGGRRRLRGHPAPGRGQQGSPRGAAAGRQRDGGGGCAELGRSLSPSQLLKTTSESMEQLPSDSMDSVSAWKKSQTFKILTAQEYVASRPGTILLPHSAFLQKGDNMGRLLDVESGRPEFKSSLRDIVIANIYTVLTMFQASAKGFTDIISFHFQDKSGRQPSAITNNSRSSHNQ